MIFKSARYRPIHSLFFILRRFKLRLSFRKPILGGSYLGGRIGFFLRISRRLYGRRRRRRFALRLF
jgi:hypothetical protein